MIDVLSSDEGVAPITIEATFPASAERIFNAWTEAAKFRKWFGIDPAYTQDVQIDLRVGGRWQVTFRNGTDRLEGKYLEISRNDHLRFTWAHVEKQGDQEIRTPASEVSLILTPSGASTKLTLTHREIATEGGRIGVRKGWINSFSALGESL